MEPNPYQSPGEDDCPPEDSSFAWDNLPAWVQIILGFAAVVTAVLILGLTLLAATVGFD